MKFMSCATCHSTVQYNDTAICLACQRGFIGVPQEDAWKPQKECKTDLQKLQKRQKEVEKELNDMAKEEPSPVDVRKKSGTSKKARKQGVKRSKAPAKNK